MLCKSNQVWSARDGYTTLCNTLLFAQRSENMQAPCSCCCPPPPSFNHTGTNRIKLVLFGMQNRIIGPYSVTMHGLLILAMPHLKNFSLVC
jgi:hypothetical protein